MPALRWSLRSWLLALVVATALPCAGMLVWLNRATATSAEAEAQVHARELAIRTAQNADQSIDEARSLLERLAARPQVRAMRADGCDPILNELQALHTIYTSVDVLDREGRVVCTTPPARLDRPAPLSHRGSEWLEAVVATRQFTLGAPQRGPVSGRWVSALANPILDERGEVAGVIVIALDLLNFGARLQPDASGLGRASFFDLRGNMVARSTPDAPELVGKNYLRLSHVARAMSEPLSSYTATEGAEDKRIFGVAPMAGGRWRVMVSLSEKAVLAPARARAAAALRTGFLVILFVAATTYWLSRRLARPIQALAEVARRAASGEPAARVPEEGPREVREAVMRFNELLEARSSAEHALRVSNDRITKLNRILRTTSSVSQMLARETDRQRVLEGACRVLVEEGGIRGAGVVFALPDGAVQPAAAAGLVLDDLGGVRTDEPPAASGAIGAAIRSGEVVVVRDASEVSHPPSRERAERYGYRSWAAFPLRERGRVVGAVAVHAAEPDAFDEEVLKLIGELVREVGLALQHLEDLSERKSAEAALEESKASLMVADRLASVGRLAAGVAHEINNPLAYVVMNTTVALEEVQRAAAEALPELRATLTEAAAALREARAGSERVRLIVRDLKLFSRADSETRVPVELSKIIESSISIAWNEIRQRARLVKDFGSVPEVLANESRLGQVFLNLLVNAAQAIEPGAEAHNEVRVVTRREGARAVVEVRDTGAGIAPDLQRKIFEPFFTTKPAGVGTGLGLAICHNIVTELGGELTVDSAPGKGSTFRVVLPLATAPTPVASPRVMSPTPGPQRARLLVVDDEPAVGNAIRRALSAEHDVVALTSAKAALEQVAAGVRFDGMLCDLMMPEMTGMELHEALERLDPRLAQRMVVMTGGVFTDAAQRFLDRVQNQRMEKPFDVQTLRATVRSALR